MADYHIVLTPKNGIASHTDMKCEFSSMDFMEVAKLSQMPTVQCFVNCLGLSLYFLKNKATQMNLVSK